MAKIKEAIEDFTPDPRPPAKVIPFRTFPQFSYADGLHWFAIYTNIACERRAQAGLDAKGFRTYLPQCTRWVSHARVRKVVKRPLLTRYLFVEMDPARQSFMAIRATDGVEAIVGTTGTPMTIPPKFVEEFLGRELAGEFDYAGKDDLPTGAKVKITSGEWDGLFGVITSGSTANNGAVMVKLLKDRREVRIRAYALRASVT